jgi:membrane carboxypeptidase/penicillin-binding protein PbpC
MKELFEKIFSNSTFEISLHCDQHVIDKDLPKLTRLLNDLKSRKKEDFQIDLSFLDSLIEKSEDICVENSNSTFSSALKFEIPLPSSLNFPALKVAEQLFQNDFFMDSI